MTTPACSFNPEGLLLTWQRDPTSTMTIQWLEPGELLPSSPGHRENATPSCVPHLDEGPVSVEAVLWKEGFAIDFLPTIDLKRFEDSEFSAVSRLAWSDGGVLVGMKIQQEDFSEAGEITKLWAGSSVEIIVADLVDGKSVPFHAAIAPGLDPAFPDPRTFLHSVDSSASQALSQPVIKVTREPGGYRLFVVIPWAAFPSFKPEEGKELAAQLYVNQGLRPGTKRLAWYPSALSGTSRDLTRHISLARNSSPPCRATLTLERGAQEGVLTFHGLPADAGKCIEVKEGDARLGEAGLEVDGGDNVARARLTLRLPAPGRRWGVLEATLDGKESYQLAPNRHFADYKAPERVTLAYGEANAPSAKTGRSKQTTVLPLTCWPGMFLHRVELTGLDADTLHQFCPEGSTGAWSFRTLPEKLTRPVRIAMGGDTLHQQEWLEETTRTAMAHDPDFIIWGGDLADANGIPEAIPRWQQWFSAIDKTLRTGERRVIPVVVALGNHDVKKGYYYNHSEYETTDAWRKFLAPEFYEFFAFPGQPGYGVLDIGDYLSVIILDSGHTNPIAGVQTEWLERTLRERAARPHVLPIYHIPAYPSVKSFDGKDEAEVRKHWPPLFDRYAIRTAFEHHNHAYKRTIPIVAGSPAPEGGTIYFGDGAWGVNVRPVHDTGQTWYLEKATSARHVITLTLYGAQQQFKVFTAEGTLLDEYNTPGEVKLHSAQ